MRCGSPTLGRFDSGAAPRRELDECRIAEEGNLPSRAVKEIPSFEIARDVACSDLATRVRVAFLRVNKGALDRLGRYKDVDEELRPYQVAYRVHNPKPGGYRYDVIHPVTKKPCREPLNGYRFPETRMKELIKEKRIILGGRTSRSCR